MEEEVGQDNSISKVKHGGGVDNIINVNTSSKRAAARAISRLGESLLSRETQRELFKRVR